MTDQDTVDKVLAWWKVYGPSYEVGKDITSGAKQALDTLTDAVRELRQQRNDWAADCTRAHNACINAVYDPDGWREDLLDAGWFEKSHTIWVAPDGTVYRGPYGAWREMKRRQRKAKP